MKRPYLLKKRSKYWYYRLAEEETFHFTGKTTKSGAELFAIELIQQKKTDTGHAEGLKDEKKAFQDSTQFLGKPFVYSASAWAFRQTVLLRVQRWPHSVDEKVPKLLQQHRKSQ